MGHSGVSPSFSAYRTVGEAAEFLGVSPATLRNWDRNCKLKPRCHPQNGYRIYLHEDLEAILRSADRSLPLPPDAPIGPAVDWNEMGETEHFVQFYESDEFLVESVSGFVGTALRENQGGIVIATSEHRDAIQRSLANSGIDLSDSVEPRELTFAIWMSNPVPDLPLPPVPKHKRHGVRRVGGIRSGRTSGAAAGRAQADHDRLPLRMRAGFHAHAAPRCPPRRFRLIRARRAGVSSAGSGGGRGCGRRGG